MTNHQPLEPTVRAIYEVALNDLHQRAVEALNANDIDGHMAYGRGYHTLADTVLTEYGVELRPTE